MYIYTGGDRHREAVTNLHSSEQACDSQQDRSQKAPAHQRHHHPLATGIQGAEKNKIKKKLWGLGFGL